MKPQDGQRVIYVDVNGKERPAWIKDVHTDADNPTVDLSFVEPGSKGPAPDPSEEVRVPHESTIQVQRPAFWREAREPAAKRRAPATAKAAKSAKAPKSKKRARAR